MTAAAVIMLVTYVNTNRQRVTWLGLGRVISFSGGPIISSSFFWGGVHGPETLNADVKYSSVVLLTLLLPLHRYHPHLARRLG